MLSNKLALIAVGDRRHSADPHIRNLLFDKKC